VLEAAHGDVGQAQDIVVGGRLREWYGGELSVFAVECSVGKGAFGLLLVSGYVLGVMHARLCSGRQC
jgi:hypothetical protein